jgi:hypothetical protein
LSDAARASSPAPAPNYGSGDLDRADVGHEVYIDGDDPNGLGGDDDGVGL